MTNRREFIKQSTGLIGFSTLDFSAPAKPLLSFSTLGCPAWSFSQVLQNAAANHYQGIEIRGIKGDLDLPNNPLFSVSNIAQTKREIADYNGKIVNLGSSANLHFIDAKKRQSNLDEAKKYIFHTHIKDAILTEKGETYTLLGEGNAPVKEALHALKSGGYTGFYSFEWEKLWHPEIQEPEIAIPHYAKNFANYWK